MTHSVGRPSKSDKARLRDLADGYGITHVEGGKPVGRATVSELQRAIGSARAREPVTTDPVTEVEKGRSK